MPTTNLRLLEARFQSLERREQRWHSANNSGGGGRYRSASDRCRHLVDPHIEQAPLSSTTMAESVGGGGEHHHHLQAGGVASFSTREAVEQTELLSGARESAAASSKAIHAVYAHSAIAMRQHASAFMERQKHLKQHAQHLAVAPDNDDGGAAFLTSVGGSGVDGSGASQQHALRMNEDGVHYVPLFSRTPTPPPSAGTATVTDPTRWHQQGTTATSNAKSTQQGGTSPSGAGSAMQLNDEQSIELEEQDRIISRMMCSDVQLNNNKAVSSSFRQQQQQTHHLRPQTANSSFVNQRPARVRVGSAAGRRPLSSSSAAAAHGRAAGMDGARLAQAFFQRLPPVIPATGVRSHVRGFESREDAVSAERQRQRCADGGDASPPTSTHANRNLRPPARQIVDVPLFARAPAYYHLQIKIVHAAASLLHWEFTVVVSDVTTPDGASPRHQFRGLTVNAHRYLIFQPPDNIILNPLQQIPWAVAPESLYGHTLRVEVFASKPVQAKVVDTMVHYGQRSDGGQ